MHRTLIAVSIALLASCVHRSGIAATPHADTGHARFEIYGMLGEYESRYSDGKRIEGFDGTFQYYLQETPLAAHFERLLRAFCAEEGINPKFDKKIESSGSITITFFSPAIAAAIDCHYIDGSLDRSVFDGASDEDLLRYAAGAYLRFGHDKINGITAGNAFRKLHTVGLVLHRLGCSGVKLYYLKETVPTVVILVFSPSPRVKKRLGIQKEVAISEIVDSRTRTIELVKEIPPNPAAKPASASVTPPARPETRLPSVVAERLPDEGPAKVTELSLGCSDVRDEDLAALKLLTKLQRLDLSGTKISDVGLAHLKALPQLDWLDLSNTRVSDAGLAHLKPLTRLQGLDLSNTRIGDAGLEHLKPLTQLEALCLSNTRVSDAGLAHLKPLTRLQWLDLDNTQVSDAGLEHLKPLTQLKGLYLGSTRVSDAGLAHLKPLTRLQRLDLIDTKISDAGLDHLKPLTQLQWLRLAYTQAGNAGLAYLETLTQLQTLDLDCTKVGDAGLKHLRTLAQLQRLLVFNTKVTKAGVKALQTHLPSSWVER